MNHDYLTLTDVIEMHRQLIARFGGSHGVREIGALESAVLRPQMGYYEDLIAEAAALMESLAMNHPFVDGNKRAGWLLAYVFLAKNGVELDPADDDEAYDLVIAVASGKLSEVDEIADVLRTFIPSS